jgi:Lrp/AsnC family transcriptional regulator, leucine-responsive regulatory protein
MQSVTGHPGRSRRLDATDARILRLLARDARASYTDLGEAVGLSANAVAQRMRRLEAARVVLGYRAVIDPSLESVGVAAVVGLRTTPEADPTDLETRLTAIVEVTDVLELAGAVAYEVRLRCSDESRLYDVVQAIRALPGVTGTETRPVLREVVRR